MSARNPPPTLPLDTFGAVAGAVEFLRRTGPPDALARTAEALEACPEIAGTAEATIGTRNLERWARFHLRTVEAWHLSFDFENGVARLPGGKRNLDAWVIGAAWDELYPNRPDPIYYRETLDAIREKLAEVLGPDGAERITDGQIRGAIQRRYKSGR